MPRRHRPRHRRRPSACRPPPSAATCSTGPTRACRAPALLDAGLADDHARAGGGLARRPTSAARCGSRTSPPDCTSASGASDRLVQIDLDRPRAGRSTPRPGLRDLPRGRGERQGRAVQGPAPDGARARLPRRPHPHRRLPVPRRPLPLRASLEPVRGHGRDAGLRRPPARRLRRGGRELLVRRQSRRHAQHRRGGRASPAGRATSRSRTRAPTGSGSSAHGARACASWSTTSSRTGRCARSTRSSRTTATR